MKIAIVSHGLHVAGGRSVASNIIEAFAKVASSEHYLLIMPKDAGYEGILKPEHSESAYIPHQPNPFKRAFFDETKLNRMVKSWHPDVIFCLGNYGLSISNIPQAVLYHKPHFVYPEVDIELTFREKIKNSLIKFQIKRSGRHTNLVFCQTEALRDRYIKAFNFKGETSLLPNVVSTQISEADNLSFMQQHRSVVDGKFVFLTLTRYYTHKNLEAIVEAFKVYREELSDCCCLFTIDESQHKNVKPLLKEIKEQDLENNIINIGPVNQDLLASLYHLCDALLLPTLLESFSGTYVEAMKYRVPVLTSDRDFARAVCGDAAMYLDPLDCSSIKDAMLDLKSSQQLQAELVKEGVQRLDTFPLSWIEVIEGAFQEIKKIA